MEREQYGNQVMHEGSIDSLGIKDSPLYRHCKEDHNLFLHLTSQHVRGERASSQKSCNAGYIKVSSSPFIRALGEVIASVQCVY